MTKEQKEDKVKAYKKKLGLGDDDDSDSKSSKENIDKTKEPSDTTQ